MLIDLDSKPKDTVFYIAMQIHDLLRDKGSIKINELDSTLSKINPNQPAFKYKLALSFLFLLEKIQIFENEVRYVPN